MPADNPETNVSLDEWLSETIGSPDLDRELSVVVLVDDRPAALSWVNANRAHGLADHDLTGTARAYRRRGPRAPREAGGRSALRRGGHLPRHDGERLRERGHARDQRRARVRAVHGRDRVGEAARVSEVVLSYRAPSADVKAVRLRTDAYKRNAPPEFRRRGRTRTWELRVPRPDGLARLEYELEVERADGTTETVADPENPLRASAPFGERSVLELDGYERPVWLDDDEAPGRDDRAPLDPVAAPARGRRRVRLVGERRRARRAAAAARRPRRARVRRSTRRCSACSTRRSPSSS